VNIEAISIANVVDHAVVRLVVSDARTAMHVLGDAGTLVFPSEVLAVDLPDTPGAIAELADTLGRARINIDYMYGSSRPNRAGSSVLYLRVADPAAARRALARLLAAPTRRPPRKVTGRRATRRS
jgi:hypothetical protein